MPQSLVFQLDLGPLCDYADASLERALRLLALVLGFDMRVESRVRQVALAAPALVVSSFFVLARSA